MNQRTRREGLVIDSIHATEVFSPGAPGKTGVARIDFRIKGPDEIDLDIVDANGDRVRRIANDKTLPDRVQAYFRWDGHDDSGRVAAPGTYSLRVYEHRRDRTITPPGETILVAPAPPRAGIGGAK